MKKMMIQFHATIEELTDYTNSVSSELGLIKTMMTIRPFSLREMGRDFSKDDFLSFDEVRIIFTKIKVDTDASSPNNFYDLNPGTIGLHVGRIVEQGLKESALVFISDDTEKVSIANKMLSKLKKITTAGAIAVNPVTGAEVNIRSHRYTDGAREMFERGVKLLPAAGNSYFKLF